MLLESRSLDASFAKLLRCSGCWGEPFDPVAVKLCTFADHRQGGGLAPTGNTVQSHDLFPREKDLVHRFKLRRIQFWMTVFGGDTDRRRNEHWIAVIASVAPQHSVNDLALHPCHSSGRVLSAGADLRKFLELSRIDPALKFLLDVAVGGFSHAAR